MSKEAQPPQVPKNPHPQKPCPKVPPSRRKSGNLKIIKNMCKVTV